jgi:hypothetical protein
MAIGDLNTYYGARWTAPSVNYTLGSFRNRTAPGSDDGSYNEQDWINDYIAYPQSLINASGIVPNGSPDDVTTCQVMEGLVEQVSGRSINYDSSGPANAYVLTVRSDQYGPQSYFDGMKVEFTPNITNTGASTVNVNGLGIISVTNTASGGELPINTAVRIRYNGTTAQFEIIFRAIAGLGVTTTVLNGGTIDQTFDTINWRSLAFPAGPQGNMTYGVTPGTAEVFRWQHNGADSPKFEWASALGGDGMVLDGPGGTSLLQVFGSIQSGTLGDKAVPNEDDFFTNNSGVAWYQNFPGSSRILSFTSPVVTDATTLVVSWGSGTTFTVIPAAVNITPTNPTSGGGWAAFNPTATNFSLRNNSGVDQAFNVIVIGSF